MALQVNSNFALGTSAADNVRSSQHPVTPSSATSTHTTQDTVKLSFSAQVHQLRSQGLSAKQIATALGTTLSALTTYLPAASVKSSAAGFAQAPETDTETSKSVVVEGHTTTTEGDLSQSQPHLASSLTAAAKG